VVFTGETGAGKSLLVDALEALLGGRVDSAAVRTGEKTAVVEGVFSLDAAVRETIRPILEREELLDDDEAETVTLAREIRREGRSVARVNGRSVAVALLKEIGEGLVDVHGQSEHLSLYQPRRHLPLLDRFAGVDAERCAYRAAYSNLVEVRRRRRQCAEAERATARRLDLLRHQVDEIESAGVEVDEEPRLRSERGRLANNERLAVLGRQVLEWLDGEGEGGAGGSATESIGRAARLLGEAAGLDDAQAATVERLAAVASLLGDVAAEVRSTLDSLEFNPERLEAVDDRLALMHQLKRKYGDTLAAVVAFGEQARRDLDDAQQAGERSAASAAEEA
ncbi:MAG: DNA repair protein RecN, partial [Planctomycetia bacterium]